MRERSPVKGASLGKEAVLAASGRVGEVAAGVGRVRKMAFSASCLIAHFEHEIETETHEEHIGHPCSDKGGQNPATA
jgi:hypothetical protein